MHIRNLHCGIAFAQFLDKMTGVKNSIPVAHRQKLDIFSTTNRELNDRRR